MQTLLLKTRTLLKSDSRPLTRVAEESGLPYHWVHSFRYREHRDPSVNRVQRLYEYLTGESLPIK